MNKNVEVIFRGLLKEIELNSGHFQYLIGLSVTLIDIAPLYPLAHP